MVASLLKIVSTGMQDERLQPPKGQPDLGSFLTVMVKAGRYATNWTRIDFDTKPDFGKSSVIRLPTKGEMIGRVYLVTQMPDIATIQRKAYYTRKPIRLASLDYTQINLFEIESYIQTTNLSFPKLFKAPIYPVPDYGLANFSGYQLDDLNIDGTYTLTLTLPPNTSATTAVTTFILTDMALKDPQFTLLNTDTFFVTGLSWSGIGDIILFMYSYNGTVWQRSPAFTGLNNGDIYALAYNESLYLAVGSYQPVLKSIIIENTTETIVQPGFTACRRIAYNGSQYVSVGTVYDPPGSISYSTDGLTWTPAFHPPDLTVGYYGAGGYSVAWVPTTGNSKWLAVGQWGDTGFPSGIITTSPDGVTWTTPSYIQTAAYIFGTSTNPNFFTDLTAYLALLNIWQSNIDTLDYYRNGNGGTDGTDSFVHVYTTFIQPIVTSIIACNSSPSNPSTGYRQLSSLLTTMFSNLITYSTSIQQFITLLSSTKDNNTILDLRYDIMLSQVQTYYNYIIVLSNIPSLSAPIADYTNALQGLLTVTARFSNDTPLETATLNLLTALKATVNAGGTFYNSINQINTIYNAAVLLDPTYSNVSSQISLHTGIWYSLYLAINSLSTTTAPNLNTQHLAAIASFNTAYIAEIQNTAKVGPFDIFNTSINDPGTGIAIYTNILPIQSGTATCIAVNGSQIVIGGQFYQYASNTNYTGSLIYSADGGTTWTYPTDPANSSGGAQDPITYDVAWTGSIWVAAGRWIDNTVSFSSDGITWLAAINPLNTNAGTAYTIALSPTDMVIGGVWSLNDNTTGSLTKASGTSLDYKWSTIVRPTPLATNVVNIYGISYDSTSGSYILVGEWRNSTGTLLGNLSISSDGQTWQTPMIPYNTSKVFSRAYAAATNGSIWVVVGYWRSTSGGTGNTIAYSDNLSPPFYSNWQFADSDRTGYGQNIVFDSYLSLFIVVGSWYDGYITISTNDGGTSFNTPVFLPGTTSGTGYSIVPTIKPGRYMFGGTFYNTPSTSYESLANITIDSGSGAVTLNVFTSPQSIDPTQVQLASSIAWNGLGGALSAYVAVGRWILQGNTYGTLCFSNDGLTWQQPFNPTGISQALANIGNSVAWNGTQFVAMGVWNGSTICTSVDGLTWTVPTNPPEASLGTTNTGSSAVWNGSTWVVAGNWFNTLGTAVGNITSFTYGINFSKPVNPNGAVNGSTTTVIWNPNTSKWLAGSGLVGKNGGVWADGDIYFSTITTGILSSSTDGLIWTTPTNLKGVQEFVPFSQIAVINSRVYIIGGIYYNYQPLMRSTNGINWSIQPFTDTKYGTGFGIAWNGSAWTAVGLFQIKDWGTNINAPIIISTDGQTWSDPIFPIVPITPTIQVVLNLPAAKLGTSYTAQLNGIAWNGQIWVAVGQIKLILGDPAGETQQYTIGQIVTCSDINNLIWIMTPIRALETIDNYSSINQSYGTAVAWNGQLWVAVGVFGLTLKYITTSSDGINWSDPIGPANIIGGTAYGVAWNGHVWIVVGSWQDTDGYKYNIIRSIDGYTWSPAINAIPLTEYPLSTITWNGTSFVAGGGNNSNGRGILLTSPDGITWTYVNDSLPGQPNGVISKRTLPYTTPQFSDPTVTVFSQTQDNGYTMSWVRDHNYGTGSQVLTTLTPGQPFTYTFTATQRTQWLTLGTYYSPPTIIDISLNLLTPAVGNFQTDLVGPHFGWTNNLGHSLIDSASITIGGNLVETINGQLMEVLDEFQTPLEKVNEKSRQLCRAESGFTQKTYGYSNATGQLVTTHLPFWFSRGDPGCTLPIDALNVDEVRLTVNFKPITSLYYTDSRTATPALNVEGGSLWPLVTSQFYYEDTSGTMLPNLEPFRSYINPTIAFPKINMPQTYSIQDSHLMVEYIYLDKAEANRFRIADLQVPIVQHYTLNPEDTNKNTFAKVRLDIPNPTRDLFFYCQRYEAPSLNAHFLATRDLSKNQTNPYSLWWPDASGLDARFYGTLRPGFSTSGSEPIRWLALNYAETLNRYSTENVALFRSLLPSMEQRKAPWINRYYYNLPFGCQNGLNPISTPLGNANLDKVQRISLALGFHGITGDPTDSYAERFWVRTFAETYNIFRVYGGRGTMMFAY